MVERARLAKDMHIRWGDEYRSIFLYVIENGEDRRIDLDDQISLTSTDGSWLAEMFLLRIMMRTANMKLKGTPFEKVAWQIYPEGNHAPSDICYIKRIDDENYAYVKADYFFMT